MSEATPHKGKRGNGAAPPVSPLPVASVFDDLEALRVDETSEPKRKEKKLLVTVKVKRPSEGNYFRVHPELSWVGHTYTYEVDGSVWYVPPGDAFEELKELTTQVRRVRLFLCITKRGSVSFWPVSQTDQGSWGTSARSIAEVAKDQWIRVISNREEGEYIPLEPEDPIPEPEWPAKEIGELLKMAFKGKVIDRVDHPIINSLKNRGE